MSVLLATGWSPTCSGLGCLAFGDSLSSGPLTPKRFGERAVAVKHLALLLVLAVALLASRAPAAEIKTTFPGAEFSGFGAGTAGHGGALRPGGTGFGLVSGELAFPGVAPSRPGLDEVEPTVVSTAFTGRPLSGGGELGKGFGTSVPDESDANQVGAETLRLPRVEAAATPPAGGTRPKSGQGATCHAASTFIL
jgi:hypothetical protein